MTKQIIVTVDTKNRIALGRVSKNLAAQYRVYEKNGNIILEPIREIPKEQAWLFEPQNKHILEELKESLKQKATIPWKEIE